MFEVRNEVIASGFPAKYWQAGHLSNGGLFGLVSVDWRFGQAG